MKTLFAFLIFSMGMDVMAFADSQRITTADLYTVSYIAAMQHQTGEASADLQMPAPASYEICDEHHICLSVTPGSREEISARQRAMMNDVQRIKPFLDVPIWH